MKRPPCFYCDQPTNLATSRIDGASVVCSGHARMEKFEPEKAIAEYLAAGGEAAAVERFRKRLEHQPAGGVL